MPEKTCRVCFQRENNVVDMLASPLPTYAGDNISILEMFVVCTEIAMQVGENSILCIKCLERLIEAYKFRIEAQNAVAFLEKLNPIIMKEPKKEEFDVTMMNDTNPVRPEKRKSLPPTTPGMLNRLHCRFCLKYVKNQLREHEQIHIG